MDGMTKIHININMLPSFAEFTVCLQIIVVCGRRKNVQFKIMKLLINYQGIEVGEIIFADKNPGAVNWFCSACIQDCYLGLEFCRFYDYIFRRKQFRTKQRSLIQK